MNDLKTNSRQMHRLYLQLWRFRNTAPGLDIGDDAHRRMQCRIELGRLCRGIEDHTRQMARGLTTLSCATRLAWARKVESE